MDEQTRNQLIGAVVWFVALILLVGHWYSHPVVFQPGNVSGDDRKVDKPLVTHPLVVELPTALPAKTLPERAPEVAPRPEAKPVEPAVKPAARKPTPPRVGAAPKAQWIVKVAAYFTARQANELVAALNEAGYDATYKKFKNRKGQVVYSVRVGPYDTREAALAAKRRIDRRWRADSLIERVKMEQ